MVNKSFQFLCCFFRRLLDLKREISSQTDIALADLLIVNPKTTSNQTETETVGWVFPTTSLEIPVIITSANMAAWRSATRIKPTLRES